MGQRSRRMLLWLSLAGSVVLLGSGCAMMRSDPAAPPTVDVTGVWAGTWDFGSFSGTARLELEQTGPNVVGHAYIPGAANVSGYVSGTVVGNHFSYRAGMGGAELDVKGNEMNGYGAATSGVRMHFQRVTVIKQ